MAAAAAAAAAATCGPYFLMQECGGFVIQLLLPVIQNFPAAQR